LTLFKERAFELLNRDRGQYSQVLTQDSGLVTRLENKIRTEFLRRKQTGYEPGYKTGARINLRKRISEVAKELPAGASRAWERISSPVELDYGFQLLLDMSLSMKGEKIRQAFRGAVVLTEALHRVGVPFEILGFNSKLYEFKTFTQPVNAIVRDGLGGILGSTGACTDLGWAISQCAERFTAQACKERVLVVLTDGEPSPSPEHGGSHYRVVNVLERIRTQTPIRIIAVGLGISSKKLAKHMPGVPIIGDVKADQLPSVFAEVVQDAILDQRHSNPPK
jgi:cobalamin biosynthesis protein CobT